MTDRTKQRELQQKVLTLRRKLSRGGKLTDADRALVMEAAKFADAMPENAGMSSAVDLASYTLEHTK